MSVVGFDFGYDTCYISVARGGGIETIANDYSMRESPSVVGFDDRNRVMCVSAKNKLLTNLSRTFFGFKNLLGRAFDDPIVQAEQKLLPFPLTKAPNGMVLVTVEYRGKKQQLTPEQLTAMLFTKLRETADAALQTKVKDCVISVPVYFTDSERRAVLDAATIAGLHVLKLINDTTATALAYGIYKQDLPGPEEKARNVIFVDAGHVGLQAAACSFNKGKLVMQACSFHRNCGGRDFTDKIVRHLSNDIQSRFGVDPYSKPKALLRLESEAEKLKKQMSANTNKLPLNIECFMEDKDVNSSIDRATFENLISSELASIEKVLQSCLAASKWKTEEIHSVEIVGGSTRVPAIKALVEKVFGKTPHTTLNADEAVSRGCALQCAILSPTFKVREFSVTDIQPFSIKLKWQSEDKEAGEMEVFPKFHPVPFSKVLTFYRKSDFWLQGEYEDDAPILDKKIGFFEIGEIKPMEDGSNQKVKVKVRVNLNGIFLVTEANRVEKQEIEEEVPMEVDAESKSKEKSEEGNNDITMDTASSEEGQKKCERRKKTVNKTVDLPITAVALGSLSREKLEQFFEMEKSLTMQDKQEAERLTAKNAVEEYIYDVRAKINEEWEDFISEDDRSKLSLELEDVENWLYDDGEDCEQKVYCDKLKELKVKGEPIKKRKIEFDERPRAIDAMGRAIQQANKAVEMYNSGDDKYAHIEKTEMEKVIKAIEEKQNWFEKSCNDLSAISKNSDPPILVSQFFNEKTALENVINPILNRPKPKVEPPSTNEEGVSEAKKNEESAKEQSKAKEESVNGNCEGEMDLD